MKEETWYQTTCRNHIFLWNTKACAFGLVQIRKNFNQILETTVDVEI